MKEEKREALRGNVKEEEGSCLEILREGGRRRGKLKDVESVRKSRKAKKMRCLKKEGRKL